MVNTRAMHIFEGPVHGSNLHDSLFFFFFLIFKVTIIKTTSFWFYFKLNIKLKSLISIQYPATSKHFNPSISVKKKTKLDQKNPKQKNRRR